MVEYNGHKYGFRYTVKARRQIADLFPAGVKDTRKFLSTVGNGAACLINDQQMCILSEAYERHEASIDPAYKPQPLTLDLLDDLDDMAIYDAFYNEAIAAINEGSAREVEAVPAKKEAAPR